MSRADSAVDKFKSGFNCAQSVLFSYAGALNLSEETALKISHGFGGGMGRKQEVCGAVTGALMVLGLIYGRSTLVGEMHDTMYAKVREFTDAFEKENGTIICKDLLPGCTLLTEEGQKLFKENNLKEKCCGFVRNSCKILEKMQLPVKTH